jgi:hypothetical protein
MRPANVWKACLPVVLLFAGLVLNSCGNEPANANPTRKAETFIIQDNTFVIRSDSDPDITVNDTATVYRMVSSGTVFFTVLGETSTRTIPLVANDLVVERPSVQAVTVLREAL